MVDHAAVSDLINLVSVIRVRPLRRPLTLAHPGVDVRPVPDVAHNTLSLTNPTHKHNSIFKRNIKMIEHKKNPGAYPFTTKNNACFLTTCIVNHPKYLHINTT